MVKGVGVSDYLREVIIYISIYGGDYLREVTS